MQEPHNLKLYHSRWNSVCGRISLFTSADRNWHRVRLLVKFLSERLFKTPVLLCLILWTGSRQNWKQTNWGPFRECVEPSACAISLALSFLLSRQGPGTYAQPSTACCTEILQTLFLSNQLQMTVCRPADRRPTHGHTALSQRCHNYKINDKVKQRQCKDDIT